jgi:hypothetical protein
MTSVRLRQLPRPVVDLTEDPEDTDDEEKVYTPSNPPPRQVIRWAHPALARRQWLMRGAVIQERFENLARYPIISLHPEITPGEVFRSYICRIHRSGQHIMFDVRAPQNPDEPRRRLYEARYSTEDSMDSRLIERLILDSVGTPTMEEVIEEENRENGTDFRVVASYQDRNATVYLDDRPIQRDIPQVAESKLPEIKEAYTEQELEKINDQLIEQAIFAHTQTGELRDRADLSFRDMADCAPWNIARRREATDGRIHAGARAGPTAGIPTTPRIPTTMVNNRIVADGRIHVEPASGVQTLQDPTSFIADSDSETVSMPELIEVLSEDSNSEEEVEEELVGSGDSEDNETDNSVESHMMTVNPYFRRKAIPSNGIFESSFDDSDEDSSDVGEVIVTNLQPIPETDKIIADSGASRSVVNSRFPGPLTGLQPCSGSILGSDPTSTKGRITGRAWTIFRGEKIRVFIGNVPKSVVAINDVTATTPISFLFKRGQCVVQHDDQRVQSRITTREGLTYLPVEMFTKSY